MKLLDIKDDKIVPLFVGEKFDHELSRIKSLPGRKFNFIEKRWEIPLSCLDVVVKQLHDYQLSPNVQNAIKSKSIVLEKQTKFTPEQLLNAAKLNDILPCGLSLREHQKDGIKWLLQKPSAILSDDMGLGKTITSLVVARSFWRLDDNIQIIVICPVSLKQNWYNEAAKVGVNITAYSWAKIPEVPVNQDFVLLVDEAHYAQNRKSQRTKKLLNLSKQTGCMACYLLTGTPMKNGRPVNLFPLLSVINHPIAQDSNHYLRRYCNAQWTEIGRSRKRIWDESGAINLDELADFTSDSILRRMKNEVLTLPPKIRIIKPLELDNTESKQLVSEIKDCMRDFWERAKKGEVSIESQALVQLGVIRRISSKYKVPTVIEMVQELIEQNQQVVIFTEYLETCNLLYNQLAIDLGYDCVLLTGSTKDRQLVVDNFQSGKAKVFIGTTKAGGVGITLTKASNLILVDRPWTPGDTEQAEDRCYRIGQENSVFCYWLQLGEVDKGIDDLLEGKQANINVVLKGKTSSITTTNLNDFAKEIIKKYK